MGALVLQTAPTEEAVTVEEALHHSRIDESEDESLIQAIIKVATETAEAATKRKLITQTWAYYLDDWPSGRDYIELPFPPLQSVTTIKYTDYNGTQTTWSNSEYTYDIYKEPGRVCLAYGYTWPSATLNVTSPIEIIFVCGYGTPDDVPEGIKQAMKIHISDLYENRESYTIGNYNKLPFLDQLYAPWQVYTWHIDE